MATILREMGGDEGLQACPYLVYASDHLQRAAETLAKAFGPDYARLAQSVTQLNHLQRQARASAEAYGAAGARGRSENIRRMLLAFSRDLRVVLVRLASRLQTGTARPYQRLCHTRQGRERSPHGLPQLDAAAVAPAWSRYRGAVGRSACR
ncbi:MAG: HD domain-containing protein [Alphaproteobacteria bacterium]|nr:HD domain-containing protein [Alphaproteobacteria bacterium]